MVVFRRCNVGLERFWIVGRRVVTYFLQEVVILKNRSQEYLMEQRLETANLVEFWGLPPSIPLLQCGNRLGFEICSVNSCQSEQGSLVTGI